MGYTFFTGETAEVLRKSKNEGGYNAASEMFIFGYQFEKQYLNGGDIQGLFEFIPQVTGLDQGMFLPSLTFLNGIRSNQSGLEFAFGPTFYAQRTERKYLLDDVWYRPTDRKNEENLPLEDRLDSRGLVQIKANLAFAIGKSFKSGNMNFPVNLYYVPNKNQPRFGFSFGYNLRK